MFNIGGSEMFFILIIVLLFFGPKKIPEIAKGLGKGLREIRDAANGIERELTKEIKDVKEETDIKEISEKKD